MSKVTASQMRTLKGERQEIAGKLASVLRQAAPYLPDDEAMNLERPLDRPVCPVGDYLNSLAQHPEQHRVDALVVERDRDGHQELVPYTSSHRLLAACRAANRGALTTERKRIIKERQAIIAEQEAKRVREGFEDDGGTTTTGGTLVGHEFIQLLGGPFSKQLYWYDYLKMHALAFEAKNHNPIAKLIIQMKTDFILGRGVSVEERQEKAKSDPKGKQPVPGEMVAPTVSRGQQIIDEFWKRNRMGHRLRVWVDELHIYGEVMPRLFTLPNKTVTVRAVDPSTVWEIVTDPDDLENIYYYHQQYPTRWQLAFGTLNPGATGQPKTISDYIIRQIPAEQMKHYKINAVSNEVRGRSDLFAVLGWLKRIKDYLTYRVVKAKNESAFVWDTTIKGNAADVQAWLNQGYTEPEAGSEFAHSDAVTRVPMVPSIAAGRGDTVTDWLLSMIAIGCSLPVEYFGAVTDISSGSRAGAIVGTEPVAKHIQSRQLMVEELITEIVEYVLWVGGITGTPDIECTFPEIQVSDRSKKIADTLTAFDAKAIAHRTASNIIAKELSVSSYDYDDEQVEISKEPATVKDWSNIQIFPNSGGGQAAPSNGSTPTAPPSRPPGRGEDMTATGKDGIKQQHKTL